MIKEKLDNDGILNPKGEPGWLISSIKSILTNEKYCGDVLGQKTYKECVIGGKVMKNNGQLPQVLVQNNHPGIVAREMFYTQPRGERYEGQWKQDLKWGQGRQLWHNFATYEGACTARVSTPLPTAHG